jgi:tripartite-type tricarboxylate transporter receptor subunit TctC
MVKEHILSKRPIKLIAPAAIGTNIDVQARLIAEAAMPFLGNSIKIENKPGERTVTGVMEALKAPADGYTLVFLMIPSIAIQPYLHGTPYTYEDLVPIANVAETYIMLYSNFDSPWLTMQDFIDYAKSTQPRVGCSGIGLLPHLAGIELAKKTQVDFSYVPYQSSIHAVEAIRENQVEAVLVLSSAHSEKVRALAIFEPERKSSLPHVPTAREQGYDVIGYVRDSIAVKKGTPQEAITILENVFKKALETEKIRTAFFKRNTEIKYLNSEYTMKLWASAVETYRPVIGELKKTEK